MPKLYLLTRIRAYAIEQLTNRGLTPVSRHFAGGIRSFTASAV